MEPAVCNNRLLDVEFPYFMRGCEFVVMNTRTKKTDLFFNRWGCLFSCPKVTLNREFQFGAKSKPAYAQLLCSAVFIDLTINKFKERMEQRMVIPYGFKKMSNGNVRIVSAEIEAVQRIYRLYLDGASLGCIADELETDQVVAPSGNAK